MIRVWNTLRIINLNSSFVLFKLHLNHQNQNKIKYSILWSDRHKIYHIQHIHTDTNILTWEITWADHWWKNWLIESKWKIMLYHKFSAIIPDLFLKLKILLSNNLKMKSKKKIELILNMKQMEYYFNWEFCVDRNSTERYSKLVE